MKIVILDRDGVINFDSPDYIKSTQEWIPIPGSIEAIRILSSHGFKIYIATNQAGVGRRIFTLNALKKIHGKMIDVIEKRGGRLQGIFYCPHHPDALCECRKPGIGLLKQIADHAGNNLENQPFVGDSLKDIQAARAMGCNPVLVKTGNGLQTLNSLEQTVDVYDDLLAFANTLVPQERK